MRTQAERAIREFTAQPLAILPEKLDEIQAFLRRRHAKDELSAEEMQAIIGQSRRTQLRAGTGGVAVIPLSGVLFHRAEALRESSGGTSAERFAANVQAAADDDGIEHIVIDANTPGGSVQGIAEAAEAVFEARQKKRITTVANALLASAGYWIGAAAHEIVATPSAIVGNIGTLFVHFEFSRALDAEGVTVTVISSGDFKAEGNPFEALTPEARAAIQARTDEFYRLFVEDVARFRGVTPQAVRTGFGRGRALPARQAEDERMIDRVAAFEDVLGELGVSARSQITAGPVQASDVARVLEAPVGAVARIRTDIPVSGPAKPYRLEPDAKTTDDPDAAGAASGAVASAPDTSPAPEAREDAMSDKDTAAQGGAATVTAAEDREQERKRATDIANLCALHRVPERAGDYIAKGLTADQVGRELGELAHQKLQAMTAPAVELSERESREYSVSRAVMGQVDKGEAWSGFEREVHDEISKKLPADYAYQGGILMPIRGRGLRVPVAAGPDRLGDLRALVQGSGLPAAVQERMLNSLGTSAQLETGTPTAGGNLVFTERGEHIDLLRARMQVIRLGARSLAGLTSPVAFTKQTAGSAFTWVAENPGADVADTDATFGQVPLDPKSGQSSTAYTRQLLTLGLPDVDMLVQDDLLTIAALGIDAAAIAGAGGDAPTGVLNTTGVNVVAIGTNGGVPTYAHLVDMETEIATDNADIGALAYLTTPGIRGVLKKTQVFSGTNGQAVWTGGMEGEANGYRAVVSTQVPSNLDKGTTVDSCHAILFGVWSQLILGYWGVVELVVDPFRLKKQALIEVTSFVMAGVAIRHPESFSVVKDATLV